MPVLTVERHIRNLLGGRWVPTALHWPPDVFALAGSLLHRSGAYVNVFNDWPPPGSGPDWGARVQRLGKRWREWKTVRAPRAVAQAWAVVRRHGDTPVADVGVHPELWHALVELLAIADEACVNVGLPRAAGSAALPLELDIQLLPDKRAGTSLCRAVDSSLLRVLPKTHTPQLGATLRSLSHHLALVPQSDVVPYWHSVPSAVRKHGLNLLLLPFPGEVRPASFTPAGHHLGNLDQRKFGFFEYRPPEMPNFEQWVEACLTRGRDSVGEIDGLVFPELSLDPAARDAVEKIAQKHGAFVVGGTWRAGTPQVVAQNQVYFYATGNGSKDVAVRFEQAKHHRWRLDRSQIVQYGIGGRLDPTRVWWESTQLGPRQLQFVAVHDWLTLCTLICEDLARQDPVAQLVRSVGPNLVIALLMDGPQTSARWSARYATVLADDPGCSVLTLTCAGMMRLARPELGVPRSRSVALWRDPSGGSTEIELPDDADAVVLSLVRQRDEEWTADGRCHSTEGGRLVLAGQHPVTTGWIS